jgi:hypothetical protein
MSHVQPRTKFLRANCGQFWERLQTLVRQFQFRFVALGKQFKRDQRIAFVSLIPPGVGDFLLRNHLGDFAAMVMHVAFVLDDELKFAAGLRLEFFMSKYQRLMSSGVVIARQTSATGASKTRSM